MSFWKFKQQMKMQMQMQKPIPLIVLIVFVVISFLLAFSHQSAWASVVKERDCIKGDFQAKISHLRPPFGLFKRILDIKKEGCTISIEHQSYKWISSHWKIDICRIPIHIKSGKKSIDVLKKNEACIIGHKNEFCQEVEKIQQFIQDDGLIFAKGEKEDLTSEHGKVYCSYLLLQAYLQKGIVFGGKEKKDAVLQGSTPTFQEFSQEKSNQTRPPLPVSTPTNQNKGKVGKIGKVKEKSKIGSEVEVESEVESESESESEGERQGLGVSSPDSSSKTKAKAKRGRTGNF